jgi:hypothetical protein
MNPRLIDPLVVCAAQFLTWVIPPLITARRLNSGRPWPEQVLYAVVLGLASQAVLGTLWDYGAWRAPHIEAMIYLTAWLGISCACLAMPPRPCHEAAPPGLSSREGWILAVIAAAAFILRTVHPWQHWALGQSDAYSHLHFIQSIKSNGMVINRMYPPGYPWVMALPAVVFDLDPYFVARYGGALWGVLLVLAVFVFLRRACASTSMALGGAYMVGVGPELHLLHKTSVGVFANQMGLFLIPVIFSFYLAWTMSTTHRRAPMLGLMLAWVAFCISTPMMTLHAAAIIGLTSLLAILQRYPGARTRLWQLAALCLPAIMLLLTHVARTADHFAEPTLNVLAHGSPTHKANLGHAHPAAENLRAPDLSSPAIEAVKDYFSLKRAGYGDRPIDLAHVVLFLAFACTLGIGMRRQSPAYTLLGVWGLLTAIQSFTGILQFSKYQREGWSLLIAGSALAGVTIGGMGNALHRNLMRWILPAAAITAGVVSFRTPPAHVMFSCAAEDSLVYWVKAISAHHAPSGQWPSHQRFQPFPVRLLPHPERTPSILVVRRLAGHDSGQGELGPVVANGMTVLVLTPDRPATFFDPKRHYLVLLETGPPLDPLPAAGTAHLKALSTEMYTTLHHVRSGCKDAHQWVTEFLSTPASTNWIMTRMTLAGDLAVLSLEPRP